jgi:hypothetical protein
MDQLTTRIHTVRVDNADCRCAEQLLPLRANELGGVRAASFDVGDGSFNVLADARVSIDDVVAVAVAAGYTVRDLPLGEDAGPPPFSDPAISAETQSELEAAVAVALEPEAGSSAAGQSDPERAELLQRYRIQVSDGYYPDLLEVIAGIPAEITFSEGHGCLAEVVFEEFGIRADLTEGGAVVHLPALEPGAYPFSCGMRMVFGSIVAREL